MNQRYMKNFLCLLVLVLLTFNCFASDQGSSSSESKPFHKEDECAVQAYFFQAGNTPLFLSNEHGAEKSQVIAGVPLRKGIGVKKFNSKADWYTAEITLKVAQEYERLTGKKPYVLIANIHRSQIDFNRSAKLAYEHPSMKPCYDDFHGVVRSTVDEIRQRWAQGYLLDIHGQNKRPNYLIRGTYNGLTIKNLREKEGGDVYQKKLGLFGRLSGLGYQVMPQYPQRETIYRGGYVVKTYGSHRPDGIDAIQLEIGKYYRKDVSVRKQLIFDLANVLSTRMNAIFKE